MSQAKVDEWLHSDRGSPWKHAAGGLVQHRDAGGSTDPSQNVGGITPSTQSANPLMQGMIQRYSSLPTEKLTELSAMMGGSAQGQVIQRLLMQRRTMPQQNPAPAQQAMPGAPQAAQAPQQVQPPQAPAFRRGGDVPKKRAIGGDMGISPSQGTPWWTRTDARDETASLPGTGFLHGATPGRADAVNTKAPAGSYVWPADVVAGLGEGNSLAGANVLHQTLESGPHGIPLQRGARGMGPPRPPPAFREASGGKVPIFEKHKAGGKTGNTAVALSDGEYVSPPRHAQKWGDGDIKKGHKIFDDMVVRFRKQIIDKMKKLPGPVKT